MSCPIKVNSNTICSGATPPFQSYQPTLALCTHSHPQTLFFFFYFKTKLFVSPRSTRPNTIEVKVHTSCHCI